MILNEKDLFDLCTIAISAARQAGEMIAAFSGKNVTVEHKNAGSSKASQVVTAVDRESQYLILNVLQESRKKYDLAILTEESVDDKSRFEKDYFWCIDPLDGTLPFIEHKSGYSVAIALVSRLGVPQIGVVYEPLTQKIYSAIIGKGCLINGVSFALNKDIKQNEFLTFVCDRSLSKQPNFDDLLSAIKRDLNVSAITTITHGGGAMNACWVLENSPAIYFKYPKEEQGGGCLWDFAATACLFNEAGGFASDMYGKPIDLNRKDATFLNHKGILYCTHPELSNYIQSLIG